MTTPLQHTSLGELGGYNPLLASSLGELSFPFAPPVVDEGGGDASRRWDQYRKQILEEDDEILALLQAFLHVVDD